MSLLEINSIDLQLSVDYHVVENHDIVSLNCHENETGDGVAIQCRVAPSGTSRVDEVLSVVLLHPELVSVAVNQNVAIQFSLYTCQCFQVSPRSDLMSVDQSYFDSANCDDLGFWESREVIKLSFCCVHLRLGRRQGLKPFLGLEKGPFSK